MSDNHHCHDDHCHTHHHHGSSCCHEGHHQSCCSHHDASCGDSHQHEERGSFAEELIEMADDAWMEVLHEKIKEQILTSSGKHLDELAQLVASANHERWKNKMSSHKGCSDFKDKIRDFFFHHQG